MKPKSNKKSDPIRDQCQTPDYGVWPIVPYLNPDWVIWEPCCGEGLMVDALRMAGCKNIIATDILTGQDIFKYFPSEHIDVVVTNPHFSGKYNVIKRLDYLNVRWAMIMPIDVLAAKTAQRIFEKSGMELILLDQRIDFKMPNLGYEGHGSQFSSEWFTHGLNIGKPITYARLNKPVRSTKPNLALIQELRNKVEAKSNPVQISMFAEVV